MVSRRNRRLLEQAHVGITKRARAEEREMNMSDELQRKIIAFVEERGMPTTHVLLAAAFYPLIAASVAAECAEICRRRSDKVGGLDERATARACSYDIEDAFPAPSER